MYGRPLSKKLYTWNENTKTFSTNEEELVLDFTGIDGVTFKAGSYCAFITGSDCTFKTEFDCTFKTGSDCTFKTDRYCAFNTGSNCIFKTDSWCTFKTGFNCTFNTGFDCRFKVGKNCSLIRSDVKGMIEIPANKKIKLNNYGISGYTIIEEKKKIPTCNGKVIEIDGKQYKLIEIKK
jgi:hypothetical protein